MPEIAEVETVRRKLKTQILNHKIKKINIIYPKMIESNINDFKNILTNNYFKDILRKGKWLIFELDNYYLLSHLRMEGKYFYVPSNTEINKHTHVIFTLDNGYDLRYNDTRKFGRMNLIKKEDINNCKEINKQGIEPNDINLNKEYLIKKFKNKRLAIKTVLLDQSIISGLGNIYADEVLFKAGINPLKKAQDISLDEANRICQSANVIITKAIKLGGTTIRSYTSSLGVTGHYQDYLMVHTKDKCSVCGNKITKIKVNGRGTYFCDKCQK